MPVDLFGWRSVHVRILAAVAGVTLLLGPARTALEGVQMAGLGRPAAASPARPPEPPEAAALPAEVAGLPNLRLVTPVRVLDTRSPGGADRPPVGYDGAGRPIAAGRLAPDTVHRFRVAGASFAGVALPADVTGVVVSVSALPGDGGAEGNLALFAGDLDAPPAGALTRLAEMAGPNLCLVTLPVLGRHAGTIAVYATVPLDLVVDVVGYLR